MDRHHQNLGAGDGIWTHDSQLGRLELYHWVTPALFQLYLQITVLKWSTFFIFAAYQNMPLQSHFRQPLPYLTTPLASQSSESEGWWAGKDSNLGSRWQQIYSLPPLSTWVPAHFTLTRLGSLPLSHQRLRESFTGKGGIRYRQNPPPSCISNRLELGLHKNFTFRNRPRVDPNKRHIIGSS